MSNLPEPVLSKKFDTIFCVHCVSRDLAVGLNDTVSVQSIVHNMYDITDCFENVTN